MKVTAHTPCGTTFTLTAETEADRELLDALHTAGQRGITFGERTQAPFEHGWVESTRVLTADRHAPDALETEAARQLLSTFSKLMRLGLGPYDPRRVSSALAGRPDAQEQLTACFEQLHEVLLTFCTVLGQDEVVGEEGGLDLAQERAALARAQRESLEIKNAIARGQYVLGAHAPTPEKNMGFVAPAVVALERRARLGAVAAALVGSEESLQFWKGSADACHILAGGTADTMALTDAQLCGDGYLPTGLEAAAKALPARFKFLTLDQMRQLLCSQGFAQFAGDIADSDTAHQVPAANEGSAV